MTESQEKEFSILGCKVKYKPLENEDTSARAVIDLVSSRIDSLKEKRPLLRDTDIAVLVALQFASEKVQLEDEYKSSIFQIEETLRSALDPSIREEKLKKDIQTFDMGSSDQDDSVSETLQPSSSDEHDFKSSF